MSEATYYVLAALLDGRLHGYGIIKKAEKMSGGSAKLTTGTLYGALDRATVRLARGDEPGRVAVTDLLRARTRRT